MLFKGKLALLNDKERHLLLVKQSIFIKAKSS